jgi:glycosyltransferase involved in cell wall biosynthesis
MTIDTLICVHSTDNQHDLLLQEAVRSVVSSSLKPNNLIIVYDACWENTQKHTEYLFDEAIHPWDQIHLGTINYIPVSKAIKQGLAVAKNFGLKFCTSDFVTYCDADDRWINSKLEIQAKWVEDHNIDFCFTQSWDIREDGALVPNCFPIGYADYHRYINDKIWKENCLCHGSAMLRRSAIEALGGYNTDRRVLGMEDWDLWQRAFKAGFTFHNIPERLYCYRLGTSVAR